MDDVYEKFRDRLTSLNLVWLDPAAFSDAVHSQGAALNNCWGFIDGTVRPIARPTRNQNIMFSGHKRVHCIKFQVCFLCYWSKNYLIVLWSIHIVGGHSKWTTCASVWPHWRKEAWCFHACRKWAGGHNGYGQLGVGTTAAYQSSPMLTKLPNMCKVAEVACGSFHTIALTKDKEVGGSVKTLKMAENETAILVAKGRFSFWRDIICSGAIVKVDELAEGCKSFTILRVCCYVASELDAQGLYSSGFERF